MKSYREQLTAIDKKLASLDEDIAKAVAKVQDGFAAKRTKLVEDRVEIAALAEKELDTSRIEQGTEVKFSYGRAENRQELVGTVLGRKATDKGAELLRISTGEGFDAQVVTVYINAVTAIGPF